MFRINYSRTIDINAKKIGANPKEIEFPASVLKEVFEIVEEESEKLSERVEVLGSKELLEVVDLNVEKLDVTDLTLSPDE